ncbi:MAG: hypothetical protein Pars92KO_21270 [Parasphingorhabdus sp.]
MSFTWEPIPWTFGFFSARRAKKAFLERANLSLNWSKAKDDWPPAGELFDDADFAVKAGVGYVAETESEKLFLFHRDWFGFPDPPEWGLVSQTKIDGSWKPLGSFEPLPATWKVPENINAEN